MYVYAPLACLLPTEAKKDCFFGGISAFGVPAAKSFMGLKSGFSARTTSTL